MLLKISVGIIGAVVVIIALCACRVGGKDDERMGMEMSDYISREAAKSAVVKAVGKGYSPFNAIVMLPAADVRPVVRCEECVHRHDRNRQSCQGRRPDFFCADGERITNWFNIADKNEKLSATMNIMEES